MDHNSDVPSTASGERSSLTVPPAARYARVVRMTAANFATLAGMSVEDVDDVRMAAEEAFVCACASGLQERMEVGFTVSEDGLEMDFQLGQTDPWADPSDDALGYARLMLDALCDSAEVLAGPARLRLVKETGSSDAL